MLGISTDFNSTISIISEWMGLGNAHAYVQIETSDPRPLLVDIANGLHYLHGHVSGPIFHGDLKGLNVLVSNDHRALLADFGFSELVDSSFDMTVELPWGGSLPWMAPERLEYADVSAASDVWAFGMTALELFTRLFPFYDCRNNRSIVNRVLLGRLPDRPNHQLTLFRMTDTWWEICSSCWKRDPKDRPSISAIIEEIKLSEAPMAHRALQVPFTQVLGSPSSPSLPRPRSQDHLSYVDITKTDVIDLRPLKNFTTAVSSIVEVNAYTKMALRTLSLASELTTKQTKHEDIMSALLMKISEVYKFLLGADTISRLNKLPGCLAKISQQILECSRFMQQYAEIKSYWSRMKKDITNTTRETIIQYNRRLDRLMWTCYDDGVQDEHVDVYRVLEDITYAGEKKHLMDMAYAQGVGIDATKRCLKGTREEILVELVEWMNGPDKDVSRVFWLAGLAGQGKSTIAHTIASWFSDLGGIGACFCFSRDREADRLHEKLFSTIARDLADRHPSLKRVLVEVVSRNRSLKRSPDIMQQWRKLNLNPVLKLMSGAAERILIVIDALDECFAECSREYILPLLASDQVAKLPTNFRIIVTSRPLSDINNALRGVSHITVKTMEEIPSACVERDIRSYICDQLPTLVNVLNEEDIVRFVRMSDGLFEWARLACEFIKSHKGGLDLKQRYHEITSHATGGEDLLDTMYTIILKDVIETTPRALTRFRSVMQQVLWASEPLSIDSMNALRYMFSNAADRYNVDIILEVMAPLLSGIANRSVPIRALHTSFHDFLTNAHRSGEFFVPRADVHLDMAFASLQVLRHDLRFNICNLASSYVFNSDVLDMDQRISTHISRHLSYACRFWGTHLQETNFCELLAIEVKYFFDDVKVLFWLETMSFLNAIQHAVTILDSSCKWLAGYAGFEDTAACARDALRFVQVFGRVVSQSTPHLYLSALPFSPLKSVFHMKFTPSFPALPRLACGHEVHWPTAQLSLEGHTDIVASVAFSPDGKIIASGSYDTTIRMWDAETGLQINPVLRGHTDRVNTIAFSPDGSRIASGSEDQTIRLWDTETGLQIGSPFKGHTSGILSIAFSHDGKQMVSSSRDKTMHLWDTQLGVQTTSRSFTEPVDSVAFSPDGTRFLTSVGVVPNTVSMWCPRTATPIGKPIEVKGLVSSVAFSRDGKLFLSGTRSGIIQVWDAESGMPVGETLVHNGGISSAAFSPVNNWVVVGVESGQLIHVWDVQSGSRVCDPLKDHTGYIASAAFSPDGKSILSGSYDHTVWTWTLGSQIYEELTSEDLHIITSFIAFKPDGKQIVLGSKDCSLRLWDAETNKIIGSPLPCSGKPEVSVATLSPDGKCLLWGSTDGTISLCDIETGALVFKPVKLPGSEIWQLAFHSNGKRFLSISGTKHCEDTAIAWNAEDGQRLDMTFPVPGQCLLSNDGMYLAIGDIPQADVGVTTITTCASDTYGWHPSTDTLDIPYSEAMMTTPLAFSADNEQIAWYLSCEGILLRQRRSSSPVSKLLCGHDDLAFPGPLAISPDHRWIAVAGSMKQTIRFWNTETCSQAGHGLTAHTRPVTHIGFSPDGKRLVSVSNDNIMRVWDVESITTPETLADSIALGENPCMICGGNVQSSSAPHIINFSSQRLHALRDPHQLICGTSAMTGDWRDAVALREDGWIVGPKDRLLLWVPKSHRKWLYHTRNTLVLPRGHIELDLSNMAHGNSWQRCWDATQG